jgi:ribosomal protein S18 acetylase RimI-like enzyme
VLPKQGVRMTSTITYIHGNQNMLDDIKALWEKLNRYHCERSAYFKQHYLGMTFENRKADLLKKAEGGEMRVDVAIDEATGLSIAYIVSTLNSGKEGEIDSVYVEEPYRRMSVGGRLMQNALAWMDERGAVAKNVEVSFGNESAWGFYGRFGFLPRKTTLKQVK